MTDRELMQQALDALKVMRPACFAETTLKTADTAITALRDRLAQPEQEPVVLMDAPLLLNGQPLYTHPPQRQWVGLTDEDKAGFWKADQMNIEEWDTLFNEIEEALKEKNT